MNKTLTLLAVVLATAATTFAGDVSKKVVIAPQQDLFQAGEFQVDAFAAGAAGHYYNPGGPNHNNIGAFGGGIGANYFFTKYFGIGVDNSLGGCVGGNGVSGAVDALQGQLIGRLPIESLHLAPYGMVGGGAFWGNNKGQGNGNVGGGLEYRITHSVGLFGDYRYLYGNNNLSENLFRAGVRFVF
jgi:Outer membrane protein beta-barrel domain